MAGEFQIIERYFTRPSGDRSVVLGVGDDAAVLAIDGLAAVTVDTLVEGVHFPRDMAPDLVGYRVLAVSLSDIAAMGGEPKWCTLALTLAQVDEAWLGEFARGLFELASVHGVSLVGGDITRGPLAASLQLIGRVGERYLTRAGGRPGDDVYVTGTPGDAAAGLALRVATAAPQGTQAERGAAAVQGAYAMALRERFERPTPRVAAGRALAPLANAAIDVSDGLLADLGHICERSGCGAIVDVDALPLSEALAALVPPDAALEYALSGGDDYELCFTAPRSNAAAIDAALAACGTQARRIGRLIEGSVVECRRGGAPFAPPARGYTHF